VLVGRGPELERIHELLAFASTKTVEHHLRNVFRKLGLRRRAELARAMAENRAA
jgi:DNA-binding CsgD family transcriptional regulator